MSKSNYLESKIIQHVISQAVWAQPAALYFAMYTADPGEADTGTEMTGGNYTRKPITFATESGGQATNLLALSMDVATGRVTHFGIRDAATAGNLLYSDAFDTPIDVVNGTPLVFAAGDIIIREK